MAITAAQLLIRVAGDTKDAESSLGTLSGKIDGFGKSAMQVGARLSAWVTTPLLGVGAAAVKVAADYDRSMNLLQANTGATGDEMERLRQQAEDLGADLSLPGASAANAAEAMLELSKAGLDVNETLNASRGVLELAAAGQMNNAQAAEVAANALNAFNLEGTEAGRVADLLAAAANKSSGDVTDIADSLKMASAVAASAKIPIEDLVTAIGQMANAGIKGSDAGTSLKQMLLSLMAPTKKAKDLLEQLGIVIYDAQGNMLPMPKLIEQFSASLGGLSQEQRNAALATIFGSDAVRAANVVLMSGVDAFGEMKDAVTQAGAASQMAEAQTEGLGGAVGKIKTALTTAMISAVEPFKEDLVDLAQEIASAITGFSKLDEATRKTYVSIGLLVVGIGPAMLAIGGLFRAVSALITGFGAMKAAATVVSGAWKAGLSLTTSLEVAFGAVAVTAAAVTAAIAALVAVWYTYNQEITKTNEEGQKAFGDAWTKWFEDQTKAGKDATQMANDYLATQEAVRQGFAEANPIVSLFISNQDKLSGSYEQLSQNLYAVSDGYDEYLTNLQRVAAANNLVIDSEGNLVRLVKTQWGIRREMVQENYVLSESEYAYQKSVEAVNAAVYDGTQSALAYAGAANDVAFRNRQVQDSAQGAAEGYRYIAKAALEAGDILSIAKSSFSAADWDAGAVEATIQSMSVALGTLDEAQAQLINDVKLLSDARAAGVLSEGAYVGMLQQAKGGTLALDGAQRQQIQTQLAQAAAARQAEQDFQALTTRQIQLAQTFSQMYADQQEEYERAVVESNNRIAENEQKIAEIRQKMAQESNPEQMRQYREEIQRLGEDSLAASKGMDELIVKMRQATEAQLAQAAIGELGRSLDEGKISFDQWATAVTEVQKSFGLTNDKGVALATGLTGLTTALEQGKIPAENYDDALKALAQDAEDGSVDVAALVSAFGTVPGAAEASTSALNGGATALEDVNDKAMAAAQGVQQASGDMQTALGEPDWQGLGQNIGEGIAQGIRDSIPSIQAAAADAAAAAEGSANQEAEIKSPSKKLYRTGAFMAEGLAEGIRSGREKPVNAMAQATRLVVREAGAGRGSAPQRGEGGLGAGAIREIVNLLSGMARPQQPVDVTVNVGNEQLQRVALRGVEAQLGV